MNLQTKYALTILSLTLSLVVSFTGLILVQSRSTIRALTSTSSKAMEEGMLEEIKKKVDLLVRVLATDLTNPVYQYDMETIYDLIRNVKEQPDVAYVYVYDNKGRIIHDGTKELFQFGQILDDAVSKKAVTAKQLISQTEGDTLHVAMPITIQNELLGGLKVAFSLKEIRAGIAKMKGDLTDHYKRLEERYLFAITIMAVGFSIFGIITAVFLARNWSRPISFLSALTTRIGSGEYDVDIPIKRSDEIGQLATSFRNMVKNLKDLRQKERGQAEELHEAYLQLKKVNEDIMRANKTRDEFLSIMSHELRTPLNVIAGYSGMVKDKILGEINQKQEKALGKVIGRSKDLLSMISEILEVSSIKAKTVKAESHEVNLGSFLNDLRSNYEVPLDKELTFNWDYPPELPTIRTDSGKLKHALLNLINNAVKFTDEGNVTISAQYFPEVKAVEFKVADTGIGIQKEMLPTIFEIFRQVDSSETRSYGGVGIGLYIVKKFTDMIGGKTEVESEPGKGSTFTITIPC